MRTRGSFGRPGFLALGATLLALGACSPSPLRQGDAGERENAERRFAERGYDRGESRREVEPGSEQWLVAGQPRHVAFHLPRGVDRPPVVIYQRPAGAPPLSDDAWQARWASAGYAVLVTAMGPAPSIDERRRDWRQLLDELVRRAASGVGVASRIDVSRVALAGDAEAAQGALALVGERDPASQAEVAPPPASVRAVLALEPPADVARGGLAQRFGGIARPVLSIVASARDERLGAGGPRGARQREERPARAERREHEGREEPAAPAGLAHEAPYHFMPAGDKYLLRLAGWSAPQRAGGADEGGGAGEAQSARQPRRGPARRGGPGGPPRGEPGANRAWLAPVVAEQVSTAFLDATLGGDPIAREWLARNAGRWLSPVGELEQK